MAYHFWDCYKKAAAFILGSLPAFLLPSWIAHSPGSQLPCYELLYREAHEVNSWGPQSNSKEGTEACKQPGK